MFRFAQHDSGISEMSSDANAANRRTEKRDAKKNASRLFTGAIALKDNQIKSGALLRGTHIFALRFELRELLSGKNSFRVGQECFSALLSAACLHAFGLPRLDLALLIRREIQ